jgi:hypothetical protein
MPDKYRFEPQDILTGNAFAFRENNEMSNAQANETFIVDARFNRTLGGSGQTMAFAKLQYKVDAQVQQRRDAEADRLEKIVANLKKQPEVAAWTNKRNLVDRISPESPDKSRQMKQLKDEYEANPDIREYVSAISKQKAALNLSESFGSIANATSELFEDSKKMKKIETAGDRQLLSRAVATYEVDKLLQLNVCAEEKFGLDDQGQLFGISVQCDGVGVRNQRGTNDFGESQTCFLKTNYANAQVQKGLYDLEVLDYITGQIDRHAGNIFIETFSGKVTGIDNDASFPEIARDEMLTRSPAICNKAVRDMPRMMHTDTADKIAAINPEELRLKLQSVRPPNCGEGLSVAEIDGAVQRLMDLQSHIAKAKRGQGSLEIVTEFNQETYDRALNDQKKVGRVDGVTPRTSYLGAIEIEGQMIKAMVAVGDSKHNIYSSDTAQMAKINEDYAAYLQMPKEKQEEYCGLQSMLDSMEDKLADIRRDMAKLEHPSIKDQLLSLRHGGLDSVRQQLLSKETAIVKEMNARMNGLRLMTAQCKPSVEVAPAQGEQQNQPVAIRVNPALAGQVPKYPAPLPPGTFDHPPPSDLAPAIPDQDKLAVSPDQDKTPKAKLNFAKGKDEAEGVKPVGVEAKAKPNVAAMLHSANSTPALHDHDGRKTVGEKLRASGMLQDKPVKTPPGAPSHTHHQ